MLDHNEILQDTASVVGAADRMSNDPELMAMALRLDELAAGLVARLPEDSHTATCPKCQVLFRAMLTIRLAGVLVEVASVDAVTAVSALPGVEAAQIPKGILYRVLVDGALNLAGD